jgi:hypothetical protein
MVPFPLSRTVRRRQDGPQLGDRVGIFFVALVVRPFLSVTPIKALGKPKAVPWSEIIERAGGRNVAYS